MTSVDSIWTMQTAYHNAPLVNGYNQRVGKLYAAAVMEEDDNSLTLELANAYPEDAEVASWQRTISMDGILLHIHSAILISISVDKPKLVPRDAASLIASTTSG